MNQNNLKSVDFTNSSLLNATQKEFYDANAEEYALSQNDPRLVIHKTKTYGTLNSIGKNILDLGCGNGELLKYLKNDFGSYLGVDYSDALVNKANKDFSQENIKFFQGDIRQKLEIKRKFDIIILNDIIHHTDFNVIKHAKEYLAWGGVIIISEPILKDCNGKNFGWVWLNKPLKAKNIVPVLNTKYAKEHPPDYEFSIQEMKECFKENNLGVICEWSSQYNVVPFINRTQNYFIVKLNLWLEQILIRLNPRLALNGARYTVTLGVDA